MMLQSIRRAIKDYLRDTGARIIVEVHNADGSLAYHREQKAHSYLSAYLGLLNGLYQTQYNVSAGEATGIIDTSNNARNYPNNANSVVKCFPCLNDAANDSTYGIVIGTGNAANIAAQYALAAQVVNGSSSGQLTHGAHTINPVTNPSGGTWQFIMTRTFTNNTLGTITIAEIALYVATLSYDNALRYFCIARDVLGSPVAVLATQTLTVSYIPSITVA